MRSKGEKFTFGAHFKCLNTRLLIYFSLLCEHQPAFSHEKTHSCFNNIDLKHLD